MRNICKMLYNLQDEIKAAKQSGKTRKSLKKQLPKASRHVAKLIRKERCKRNV